MNFLNGQKGKEKMTEMKKDFERVREDRWRKLAPDCPAGKPKWDQKSKFYIECRITDEVCGYDGCFAEYWGMF